jgi:hypothetical protein
MVLSTKSGQTTNFPKKTHVENNLFASAAHLTTWEWIFLMPIQILYVVAGSAAL